MESLDWRTQYLATLPHYGDGTNEWLLAKIKAEIRTNREEL
jgi:hypothetical protein